MTTKKQPARKRKSATEEFCFVLMPFKEPFDSYYERIYAPAVQDAGLKPRRIDEVFRAGTIIKDIWDHTGNAEVLVAELTGRNPNVFYELGLAHAIGKPVILVTQTLEDVPFDLKHLRHILYDTIAPDWSAKLGERLTRAIVETLEDPAASLALPSAKPPDRGRESTGAEESEVLTHLKALESKIDYMRRESIIKTTLPGYFSRKPGTIDDLLNALRAQATWQRSLFPDTESQEVRERRLKVLKEWLETEGAELGGDES